MAPKQKPGKSKQDYTTPPELLDAVRERLRIDDFSIDLAASEDNAVCESYYSLEDDSLADKNDWNPIPGGWAWLNPPFANISAWVEKAVPEAASGAHIVMLVPASVGSDWWHECVQRECYQVFLNGRPTFGGTPINPKTGKPDPYPKDCALLLYTPWRFVGNEVWDWRN